ncbi:PREDICTED: serine protease 46-like [Chrysochloris asiatica]|uniref:Serine protease 46-like n=1 Tax=Chrysochloris asiatica TaxID=185453 RepID=A0A9B0WUY2_CHRAS|nr:PREDICTED: serine protease 46-like [Chrysochloris asiatica]
MRPWKCQLEKQNSGFRQVTVLPWFGVCGQTNVTCRVVKGKVVEEGKWPWHVSILFLGMYICSGSIFHEHWVLTAAHCFQRSKNHSEYTVRMGAQQFSSNAAQHPISLIVIHENFTNLASQDIALLRLQHPISWSHNIQPICLPDAQNKPSIGSMCWMVGQYLSLSSGVTSSPKTTASSGVQMPTLNNLQEVVVKIVNKDICNQKYQFLLKKGQQNFMGTDMLCGNLERGMKFCKVNSGSPLVCQVNKTWIQVGLVSWGFSCGRSHLPSIYTSTSSFTRWIKNQVSDVKFTSQACLAFLSPVILTGYILLVSLGSLWLL